MGAATVQFRNIRIFGLPLLNVRIWCYSIALVHLVVTAIVTLSIDLTGHEDPKVRIYSRVRWKLLTCWFNLVALAYFSLCLYCDWRETRGDDSSQLRTLRTLRDVLMTAILLPVTTYSTITFWPIFKTYPQWIAPVQVFECLPHWAQHSLHTVSMVTVVMDLLLTPRVRPKDVRLRFAVMLAFVSVYSIMVYINFLNGELVYAFLETCGSFEYLLLYLGSVVMFSIFFFGQWPLIDYIWWEKTSKAQRLE